MTQATRTIGHLEFGTPETPIVETVQRALAVFTSKYTQYKPSILMLNPHNLPYETELAALGLEVRFTNAVLAAHHAWVGAPKSGQSGPVRIIATKAVVTSLMDAPVETVIALPLPVVIETPISMALCRAMTGVPALVAPKIAGLLCAVNPRGPEVDERDDESEDDTPELAPMVLNREWIWAWRAVHVHTQADERIGVSQEKAERNMAVLRSFMIDAAKFTAPLAPFVRGTGGVVKSKGAFLSGETLSECFAVPDGPMYGPELPPEPPAPMLPQEVTMHPRDVAAELAALVEQKEQPGALSVPSRNPLSYEAHQERKRAAQVASEATQAREAESRSSEELLEEVAMERLSVTPQQLDLFIEDLRFAVGHLEIEDAGLLVDGHRLNVLDQKNKIVLHHPVAKVNPIVVATRPHESYPWEYNSKRQHVRQYLQSCAGQFAKRKIKPIKAGELYDFEMKDRGGEVAA